jgi:hypothetical protein
MKMESTFRNIQSLTILRIDSSPHSCLRVQCDVVYVSSFGTRHSVKFIGLDWVWVGYCGQKGP